CGRQSNARRIARLPVRPSEFSEFFPECPNADAHFGIALRVGHQNPDAPYALALLRARRERPGGSRAAEQRDELAPPYSITSSARASSAGGISRPSAFAVLRLMTSSYLVGACHRQIGRFLALEDAIDVSGRAPVLVDQGRPVGDQAAGGDVWAGREDRGQQAPGRPGGATTARRGG